MKIAASTLNMESVRNHRESDFFRISLENAARNAAEGPVRGPDFSTIFNAGIAQSVSDSSIEDFKPPFSGWNPPLIEFQNQPGFPGREASAVHTLIQTVLHQRTLRFNYFSHQNPFGPPRPGQLGQRAVLTGSIVHREQEEVRIATSGSLELENGQSISFSLDLSMKRTLTVERTIAMMRPISLIDPLVLSFNDSVPTFSEASFLFDLDGDGVEENFTAPSAGCGFLAFDRNCDGIINNGWELFGPATQKGFSELASFDGDGNLWIDENDPVFDKLLIWNPSTDDDKRMVPLREAGVGAISITADPSPFSLRDSQGNLIGRVKGTGIFLTEDGEARSLQEIDLAAIRSDENGSLGESDQGGEELGAIERMRGLIELQRLRWKVLKARTFLVSALRSKEIGEKLYHETWGLTDRLEKSDTTARLMKGARLSMQDILSRMLNS